MRSMVFRTGAWPADRAGLRGKAAPWAAWARLVGYGLALAGVAGVDRWLGAGGAGIPARLSPAATGRSLVSLAALAALALGLAAACAMAARGALRRHEARRLESLAAWRQGRAEGNCG